MRQSNHTESMSSYMPLFGLLLIVNALVVTFWVIVSGKIVGSGQLSFTVGLCLVAVFVGIVLILQDRVLEVTIKNVGSIKAAAEQAVIDARQIRQMAQQIEAQRSTVDLVAKEATDAKRQAEETALKNEEASEKLKQIDQTLKQSEQSVADLRAVSEFSSTILAAQNDSREAFDLLRLWAANDSHKFCKEAAAAVKALLDKHSDSMWTTYTVNWQVDPATMRFEQLIANFAHQSVVSEVKQALLDHISRREDIPKRARMEFLIYVINTNPSLDVVACAGRNFSKLAGTKIKPIAIREHQDWWAANNEGIK